MTNRAPVLRRGPVATVHAAWVGGNPLAWKVFPAKFDRRTLAVARRDQAKLGPLSAPILLVDGVERWEGRHVLRMPLCAESLAARIRRVGPLPVDDVVVLGHSLALALAAAHRVGVLHGAVNPDNVLFRVSGEPVLADFGVALREAFPRDPLHAIEYVSPETLRTSTVTEQSDLYGLGAVLHVALTGRSPHPGKLGEAPGERVLRVLRSPPPTISRPDVPVGLAATTARLLGGESSADRPADSAWAVTRLADMLPQRPNTGDLPAAHLPTSLPATSAPAGRSRGRLLAAGGVALLVLLAVAVGLGLRDNRTGGNILGEPTTSSAKSTKPTATLVTADITLATPQDFSDHVVLNWTSRRTLDSVVIIETDDQPNQYLFPQGHNTITVPVDPARRYCFLIRGSDGNLVYQSRPAAIRGAGCHE